MCKGSMRHAKKCETYLWQLYKLKHVGINKFPYLQTIHIYCKRLLITKNWIKEVMKRKINHFPVLKVALLGLRQFLASESPLKIVKIAFYFTSKALFVLMFLSWLFSHVAKLLDKRDYVNFKFYDVTAWLTNKCNTHIAQYLEK